MAAVPLQGAGAYFRGLSTLSLAVSITAPRGVESTVVPDPQLAPEGVLVDIPHAGLCGIDSNAHCCLPRLETLPRMPGHETTRIIPTQPVACAGQVAYLLHPEQEVCSAIRDFVGNELDILGSGNTWQSSS